MQPVGRFRIPSSHPALPGHFPGTPVVPGVVLLDEAFALILAGHPGRAVLGLPSVKFLRPVLPEQEVAVLCAGGSGRVPFACMVDGAEVMRGTLMLS